MPPFKDEHILMIIPGSQTTLAQLGLPESFTPARLRVSSRMFPAEKKGEWEPLKVREKKVIKHPIDLEVNGKPGENRAAEEASGRSEIIESKAEDLEEEVLYEEDPTTDEGAVFPLQAGRVVNWSCFFALLTHVYNTLSPPFHTPILVVTQPAWTAQDHEKLTQFFFEKFKTPAFCLMDSALAVSYAYATATATVVDVGFAKCDITAVSDFAVVDVGRGAALVGCGGEAMTQRLHDLLASKGFTRDMCEQLKKSSVCEVLPPGTELPGENDLEDQTTGTTAAVAVSASTSEAVPNGSIPALGSIPETLRMNPDPVDLDVDRDFKEGEDDEGVLDVASIVASGKTSEWVAKKEKEKAEKAAAKKTASDAAAAPKAAKLPNSKRVKATLHYNERKPLDELNMNGKRGIEVDNAQAVAMPKRQKTPELANGSTPEGTNEPAMTRKEERRKNRDAVAYVRKDIEVGIERFQAASGGILDRIADAVHRCILSVPEVSKRSELWDSLVILGNGSKIKGFRDALLATLSAKYLIFPSSATIFTSELPSNFTTPVATGANTPQPQSQPVSHHNPSGVNRLLLAATTASNHLAPPGQTAPPHQLQQYYQQQQQQQQQQQHLHSSHGQTPTSIKLAKMPEYFPEWKDAGIEEAAFLGAQVAAKVVFVVDQGLSKGFMSRTEFNDLGPQGIHECCL